MPLKFIDTLKHKLYTLYKNTELWSGERFLKLPLSWQRILKALKNSITLFIAHDTASMGSGLSYYTIFSIAPMLIIVISVTGAVLGPEAVSGALRGQLEHLLGANTAVLIEEMIKSAYKPGKNWIATVISIILLLTGAIGVFDQLRSSLNRIWDIKPGVKKPFLQYLTDRLFSFGMIACIAFLLLVSLLINAGIAALSSYFNHILPAFSMAVIAIAEIVISFGMTTLLFAFIYKYMSDIRMQWTNVWVGALFTSFLFAIGKYLIAIYISKSQIANTYGAASSVIVILLWVYYSAQIVFYGAEFTRALADVRGIHIKGMEISEVVPSLDTAIKENV